MKGSAIGWLLVGMFITAAATILLIQHFLIPLGPGPVPSHEIPDQVCVMENGKCVQDITAEYKNVSSDHGRECGAQDRYYETGRYICIKNISDTNNSIYKERGADKIIETYFTMIDGNTYIMDSKQVPDLKPGHLYSTVSLIQLGYCHGPSKLIHVTELNASCDGGSDCHGIPMGWVNGTRVEACA